MPILALCTASILWASAFIAFKLAFTAYDTMFVVFGRMLVATLCFLPLYPRFRSQPYRRGDWRPIVLMAKAAKNLGISERIMGLRVAKYKIDPKSSN